VTGGPGRRRAPDHDLLLPCQEPPASGYNKRGLRNPLTRIGYPALVFLVCLAASAGVWAGPSGAVLPSFDDLNREGLALLSDYLKLDTSNPPGRELQAARFLGSILQKEGIQYEIMEPVPGRANLVAWLKGDGARAPLVLLQHLDVVPPWKEQGAVEAFSGDIHDGSIWGRGALDMKGLGLIQVLAMISLKRSGLPLTRDVLLVASADEEAGSRFGMAWLMDNRQDLFQKVGLVLTEGGGNISSGGQLAYVGLEASQKAPLWLRLTARGAGGHGALLERDTATDRLIAALGRVLQYRSPIRVENPVERYFRRIAPFQPEGIRHLFEDIRSAASDPNFNLEQLGPYYGALLVNTVNLTVLRAGASINSVPIEAVAELDCRLLPSEDSRDFLQEILSLIDDPAIEVERLLEVRAARSPEKAELVRAVSDALDDLQIQAEVGPSVLPGYSDARFFRARGIPAFGFSPYRLVGAQGSGIHGRNERLGLDDFRFGLEFYYRVVAHLAMASTSDLGTRSTISGR
jgi:acetylornithine deacetylase/succinyl-diaminopimelate desuccinylase-like protein